MPIMGLGTYSLDHDTCVNSVKALLQNGGRLIDNVLYNLPQDSEEKKEPAPQKEMRMGVDD